MEITYAEFCAGIGGFRLGLESLGWKCTYKCEIDRECEKTYLGNFGERFDDYDIHRVEHNRLPHFDVLCAGFPCQPFSVAGKQQGFTDGRASVFGELVEIARLKKPKAIFLENVPNLLGHDSGRTFRHIVRSLNHVGYTLHRKVLNSTYFGVPQSRPRVYIVAFREDIPSVNFRFTEKTTGLTALRSFIRPGDYSIPISKKWHEYIELYTGKKRLEDISFDVPKTKTKLERVCPGTDLNDCILQIRSSGIRAISIDQPFPTFAVSHSGGGAMIPVYSMEKRHISLIEMKRLMGFPDDFKFPVSRTHAIKQLSNAVCPPVIQSIGALMNETLTGQKVVSSDQQYSLELAL